MLALGLVLLANLLLLASAAVVKPFAINGKLESITVDGTAYNAGGKVVVNGVPITLPKNLQFQLPAAFLSVNEVAKGSYTGFAASVLGNYVDEVALAGYIGLVESELQTTSGTIQNLAYDGAITLTTGLVVRINDPNGVFSAGYTRLPDFTADDENPSVTAFSGFPMCVPRSANDPKCPSSNRPAGQTSFDAPDPLTMAPLKPGDYITFEGVKVGGEMIAYGLLAENVQIWTPNGPTYIRIEDAIIGLHDAQADTAVEFGDSRFIGYLSNKAASITVARIDIDPCTGKESTTNVGSATPAANDPRVKFQWRAASVATTKYSREYVVTASTGTQTTTNGIVAGRYVQPVTDLIFPEPLNPGSLSALNDFSQFTNLRDGIGPDASGNVWGQLDPWPGSAAPSPFVTCSPSGTTPPPVTTMATGPSSTSTEAVTPTANAGPDQLQRPGKLVVLRGKADNAPNLTSPTYVWNQTSGPSVSVTASGADCTFTAPSVSALVKYQFQLTVISGSTAANKVNGTSQTTVTSDPAGNDTVTVDSYTWNSSKSGTISVTAHSDVIDGTAKLTLYLLNPNAGAALTMTDAGGGKWLYSATGVKKPSGGVSVVSNFRGKGMATTTTAKRRRRRGWSWAG